jgi:hypothetical protein
VPKKTGRAHVSLSLGGIGIWGTFTSPWESMDFTVDHHTAACRWLAHEKSDQNWMIDAGEKIKFPGGGTHFHHGEFLMLVVELLVLEDIFFHLM